MTKALTSPFLSAYDINKLLGSKKIKISDYLLFCIQRTREVGKDLLNAVTEELYDEAYERALLLDKQWIMTKNPLIGYVRIYIYTSMYVCMYVCMLICILYCIYLYIIAIIIIVIIMIVIMHSLYHIIYVYIYIYMYNKINGWLLSYSPFSWSFLPPFLVYSKNLHLYIYICIYICLYMFVQTSCIYQRLYCSRKL